MSTYQDLFSNVIDSSDLAEIFLLGSQDLGKLDATSRVRLFGYSNKIFRTYQGMHWQWQRGAIDGGLFKSMTTFMEDVATAPGWQQIWSFRRHQYDADFQIFMDQIFAEGKGIPLYPEFTTENG
jgi:hypothetical protein